jgi:hypothetical protein
MALRETDILNLPDAPEFISRPPTYSIAEFISLCEKMLPIWNQQRYASPMPPRKGEPFRLLEMEEKERDPQHVNNTPERSIVKSGVQEPE